MADRPRTIAVCLSEAHSFLNTGFLNELGRAAAAKGYGVAIFNSSLDLPWYQQDNPAPRAGYKAIRYDLFDALCIVNHSFHDEALVNELIAGARSHHIPVILCGAERPGCWSVMNRYEDCFKALLRHVIREHQARDTFFIAGTRNEPNSEARLQCYREVLAEEGLPFSDGQVAFGEYWGKPAAEIVRNMIRSGRKLPRAIFCANDLMAIGVCDMLRDNGIRVPEDVIVTGFDGAPAAFMVRPRLTTCADVPEELAEQIVSLVLNISSRNEEDREPRTLFHEFRPVFSESCGCPCAENDKYDALTVFRRSEALNGHENNLYHQVEQMLMQKDADSFLKTVSASLLPGSALFLNRRFLGIYSGSEYQSDHLEENMLVVPYREPNEELEIRDVLFSRLVKPENHQTGITVFNTIHADNIVCGFFSAYTNDLEADAQLIKRLTDVLNLVFTIQLGNARQQLLIHHLDNTLYMDSATELSNLRGLTRWFDSFAAREESHTRALALSVYSIYRYNYIFENYGINETDEIARLVANRLVSANPGALMIARIGDDQFAVIDAADSSAALSRIINRATEAFSRQIDSYNAVSTRSYYVEINCGCTTVEAGWTDTSLENLIRLAVGEMYLNRLNSNRSTSKPSFSASEMYSAFNLLMEKNLFKFHFQPIVDARTAQIYAYEALMRTDSLINLAPLEILAIAREYNRLYDVERATLFGIMETYVRHYADFSGSKVFINTIPGHFLNDEDCTAIREDFENYLDCFVFELTEQDTISEDELRRLKNLCKAGASAQIAIDDYGVGHSNMVNVLRYAPQIIKIDRNLIDGIQSDRNKQLFVRNTIDFAHQNGIKALAEGVENAEELKTVIDFGIDLIQGFYTGRPQDMPLAAINENIRQEILAEHLLLTRFDRNAKVYSASPDETIDLLDLAMQQYTCIRFPGGRVTLVGHKQHSVDMILRFEENAATTLTLRDVNLKGVNETSVQLGNRSTVTLVMEGVNILNKEGIRVPASSTLTLTGSGSLLVLNNRNYSVGIGANYNDPYGTIIVDMDGSLTVRSSGDKVVCIGGGRSAGNGIFLLKGKIDLTANGISVIGIGSSTGDTQIDIRSASVSAVVEGNDCVGIGSLSAFARITSAGNLEITGNCERSTGIGSMGGTADVLLEGGSVSVTTHCDIGACIGTFNGEVSVQIAGARVRIHGEGNKVAGYGSPEGACDTRIESGFVCGQVLAGEPLLLGNEMSRMIITGGNVRLFPESDHPPVSPAGLPLRIFKPEGDHYEKTFRDRRGEWTCKADRDEEGKLYVWVPRDAQED